MRRKVYIWTMCLLGLAMVASCSKQAADEPDEPKETKEVKLTFWAVQGDGADTRTKINNDKTVHWNKGDMITIFSKDDGYAFTTSDEGPSVKFDGIVTREDAVYYALYPNDYDAYHNPADPTTIITYIPASREASDNSFSNGGNITVAKTTSGEMTLAFKNVCGLIKFNIVSEHPEDITKIVLQGNNNENISGQLRITNVGVAENPDDSTNPLTATITGTGKTITLTPAYGKYFKTDTYYYIVTAPKTFSSGFTLTYYYQDANTNNPEASAVGINKTESVSVERSTIYDAGTITYTRAVP